MKLACQLSHVCATVRVVDFTPRFSLFPFLMSLERRIIVQCIHVGVSALTHYVYVPAIALYQAAESIQHSGLCQQLGRLPSGSLS